jgi:hypothetical protein
MTLRINSCYFVRYQVLATTIMKLVLFKKIIVEGDCFLGCCAA